MSEHRERDIAEAIVAGLQMGLDGQEQFRAPAYRTRLVVQIAGILEEHLYPIHQDFRRLVSKLAGMTSDRNLQREARWKAEARVRELELALETNTKEGSDG